MKFLKKTISILLTVVMLVSLVPSMSYAETAYGTLEARIAHNKNMLKQANAMTSEEVNEFLDCSLFDMFETDHTGMTEAEQAEVKAFADDLLMKAGEPQDDMEKAKVFHDWIRLNFYYYRYVPEIELVTQFGTPEDSPITLIHIYQKYGHVAARCNGFTAAFVAFCRSQGIPARAIGGYYNTPTRHSWDEGVEWEPGQEDGIATHVWPMAYIGGEWHVFDCNADCYNQYRPNEYWDKWHVASNLNHDYTAEGYNYFDVSMERLSQSHIIYFFRDFPHINPPGMIAPVSDPENGDNIIEWKYALGAERYTLYRATSKNGKYKPIYSYIDEDFQKSNKTTTFKYVDSNITPGVLYFYKVKAFHNSTESEYSTILSRCARTARTEVADVDTETPSLAKITWQEVDGAEYYVIYRASSEAGPWTNVGKSETTRFTDKSAPANEVSYYRVRCVNVVKSAPSNVMSGTVTRLESPVITVDTDKKPSYAYISWASVANADKYYVYRSPAGENEWKKLDTVYSTSYTDADVIAENSYDYKVTAARTGNTKVNSLYSEVAGGTIRKLEAPSVSVRMTSQPGSAYVSWNKVKQATKYYVYRSTSEDGKFEKIGTADDTFFVDMDGKAGVKYYYEVKAARSGNTSVTSPFSNMASGTMRNLEEPVAESSSSVPGRIKVSWDKIEGADKYLVYRSTKPDGDFKLVGTKTTASYKDNKVSPDKAYYYKVIAIRESNRSVDSDESKVTKSTAKQISEPYIEISTKTSGVIKLDWSSKKGADRYYVYRCTKKYGNYTKVSVTSRTYYRDYNVKLDHKYYYKVKAVRSSNKKANSEFSNIRCGRAK